MLKIYFTNFGYTSERQFASFAEALDYVKRIAFEAVVVREGDILASWSPISGTKFYKAKQSEMQKLGIRPADAIF